MISTYKTQKKDGYVPNDKEVNSYIRMMDKEGKGKVSQKEYVAFAINSLKQRKISL